MGKKGNQEIVPEPGDPLHKEHGRDPKADDASNIADLTGMKIRRSLALSGRSLWGEGFTKTT